MDMYSAPRACSGVQDAFPDVPGSTESSHCRVRLSWVSSGQLSRAVTQWLRRAQRERAPRLPCAVLYVRLRWAARALETHEKHRRLKGCPE